MVIRQTPKLRSPGLELILLYCYFFLGNTVKLILQKHLLNTVDLIFCGRRLTY